MSRNTKVSTHRLAKGVGMLDKLSFRGKHVAVLSKPATQTAPAKSYSFSLSSAWGIRTAPATSGFLRSALSAEATASGLSKPTRILTEHMTTK